jgi:acetyl esterase/lipase
MLHSALFVLCFSLALDEAVTDVKCEIQEGVVYSAVGGRDLLLDAYVPNTDALHPAVLVIHGGAWREGSRKQLAIYARALCKMGFVCFAIDYRLAPQHKFPAQIEDCRNAVKWIRANSNKYKVDSKRLGAIGYSAGGHLASLLATTGEAPKEGNEYADTRIQAAVAGGAPTDFRKFPEDNGAWAEYWMGGDLDEVPHKFHAASSAAFVDAEDAPVFFFNGTADQFNKSLSWTTPCFNALKECGVETELYRIEGADHFEAATDAKALEKAYSFLKKHLQESGK